MAYYDQIAKSWHTITGYRGGAFKKIVLNDLLLECIPAIAGHTVLELGAGNGYFFPLVRQRFSGQMPARVVISDQSRSLLEIAQKHFPVTGAEYQRLDVHRPFPFDDDTFDLIIATMVFNEVRTAGLKQSLSECARILTREGLLLATIIHPAFVESLAKRKLLSYKQGRCTMPGARGLRLPVVPRSIMEYRTLFRDAGFDLEEEVVFPTPAVLHAKPGLRKAGKVPLAMVFKGVRRADYKAGREKL